MPTIEEFEALKQDVEMLKEELRKSKPAIEFVARLMASEDMAVANLMAETADHFAWVNKSSSTK